LCPGFETEVVLRRPDRNAEVSRGHSRWSELHRRPERWKGHEDTAISDRTHGRKSRYLAFGATGKGEAPTVPLEGTEAGAANSVVFASCADVKDRLHLIQRTAVYGPVCTVVWEGRSREAPPYPDFKQNSVPQRMRCLACGAKRARSRVAASMGFNGSGCSGCRRRGR
jgi:hypothetical protein